MFIFNAVASFAESFFHIAKQVILVLIGIVSLILLFFVSVFNLTFGNKFIAHYPFSPGTGYTAYYISENMQNICADFGVTKEAPYLTAYFHKMAYDDRYILVQYRPESHGEKGDEEDVYCIIDTWNLTKKENLNKTEFEAERNNMGVPEKLVLKRVIRDSIFSKSIKLGSGYKLSAYSKSDSDIYIRNDSGIPTVLSDYVSEVAFNQRYILAKKLGFKRALPLEYANDYMIPDEENYEYYIIDKETGEKYGGFDEKGFEEKRKELNIPKKLKLKSISEYKSQYD